MAYHKFSWLWCFKKVHLATMLRTCWSGVALAVGRAHGLLKWCIKESLGDSECCVCEGINSVNKRGWVLKGDKGISNSDPSAGKRWDMTHGSLSKQDTTCTHQERSRHVLMTRDLQVPLLQASEEANWSAPCFRGTECACQPYHLFPLHILVSAHSEQSLPHSSWCLSPKHFHESLTY